MTAFLPAGIHATPEDSVALLVRAHAGDKAAANALFARCEERVRRVVRVRLGAKLRRFYESGDVVQEVFRSALASLEGLDIREEFDLIDWLSRVATNRIRDLANHMAAAKRGAELTHPLVDDGSRASEREPADPQLGPSDLAFQRELRALLDELVGGLPEAYREVVILRDYQGASWERVAAQLEAVNVHAARQLHQRAWIKLRILAAPRLAGLQRP